MKDNKQEKTNACKPGKASSAEVEKSTLHERAYKLKLPKAYAWKVLGLMVNDLAVFLTADEHMLVSQIVRDKDFDSYLLLDELWGLQNLSRTPMESVTHISKIRAKYAIAALLKKFQFKKQKDQQVASAIKKFYEAEDICKVFNSTGIKDLLFSETEFGAKVLTYARAFIEKVIGVNCPTNEIVTKWSRHGPGSNLDTCLSVSQNVDLFTKYSNWPYSCTRLALPYARYLIQTDKRWLGALEDSYREQFKVPKHRIINQEVFWSSVFRIEEGNRVTTVPKNALTERTIAIEPTMNLMLQLGVDGFVRSRLKRWDVDLDSQVKNQRFAYQGSLSDNENSYVTLDLKAASDTVSVALIKALFPLDWYTYLLKLRSPTGTLIGKHKDFVIYEKLSSMGNGYTFAIQSLIFSSLCYGVIRSMEGVVNPKKDFCVFGDDIIVRRKHSSKVVQALSSAGFQLNLDKSFLQGYVKESCGTDWIVGKPLRPIFLHMEPENVLDLFTDHNRLQRLFSTYFGIEESATVLKIRSWIPLEFQKYKGPLSDTEFDSYIHDKTTSDKWSYGSWRYKRLIVTPAVRRPRNLLMRKLMNSLSPHTSGEPFYWRNYRVKGSVGSGSSFMPSIRNLWKIYEAKKYSPAELWQDQYNILVPLESLTKKKHQRT